MDSDFSMIFAGKIAQLQIPVISAQSSTATTRRYRQLQVTLATLVILMDLLKLKQLHEFQALLSKKLSEFEICLLEFSND